MNLCTNAKQAIEEGADTPGEIEVSLGRLVLEEEICACGNFLVPGNYARLKVKDNGVGIAEEDISRIFEPFFTTKEVGRGTGLGLSVVRGILDDMKGGVVVQSTRGMGTEIELYFPVTEGPSDPEEPATNSDPELNEINGEGLRILFIDDEESVASSGKRLLEDVGFVVDSFSGAEEAGKSLFQKGSNYHLIITDQSMPDKTGLQFAREIRKRGLDIPILLISGFGMEITSEILEKIQKASFVEKPYTSRQLFQEIQALLN